jgi:hypothetical protein
MEWAVYNLCESYDHTIKALEVTRIFQKMGILVGKLPTPSWQLIFVEVKISGTKMCLHNVQ